jgi:3-oxoacyl-(acyl-carrier-protein) synthase
MSLALDHSGLAPSDVAAVFASANSTPALDAVEAAAIADVFGPSNVPVVAVKGALGECGASSAGSLVAASGALRSGQLPPTVGTQMLDPTCPVDVQSSSRPLRATGALLVNAFASGGTNYSVAVTIHR